MNKLALSRRICVAIIFSPCVFVLFCPIHRRGQRSLSKKYCTCTWIFVLIFDFQARVGIASLLDRIGVGEQQTGKQRIFSSTGCFDRSIDWLIDWFLVHVPIRHWAIDWLIDWLIGYDSEALNSTRRCWVMAGVWCGSSKRAKLSKMDEGDAETTTNTSGSSKQAAIKDGHGSSSSCNGHATTTTNLALITPRNERLIVCNDMCYFCFDVLFAHLHRHDPPETPNTFPNEA